LEVLLPQALDLLPLRARRQIRPQTLVGFGLTDTLPQRLRVNPEISSNMRNRPAALQRQPDAALKQLLRVLPRSRHDSGESPLPRTASWNRGLRRNRPGSSRPPMTDVGRVPALTIDLYSMPCARSWVRT